MKRAFAVASLFLLGAVASIAQNNPAPPSNDYVMYFPAPTCPVAMRALQGTGRGLLAVRDGKRIDGPSQNIRLVLAHPESKNVTAATITVRGHSGKSRIENASVAKDASLLARTLDVRMSSETSSEDFVNLVLPGFTSVTSIELNTITYGDGSTWTVSGQKSCHVAPDPFMLVADK
jgi:hypothetical protein